MIPTADFNPYLYALDAPPNWFEFEKYRRSIRKIESDCIQKDPDLPVPHRLSILIQKADDYERSVKEKGPSEDLLRKIHACAPADISQADLEKLDILATFEAIEDELLADKVALLISVLCDKWLDPPTADEPLSTDQPTSKPRFRFVHIADLQLKPPEFLIKPWLEKDTLSLSFGDPGCGKSFFAIDLAACVATGSAFHDLQVNQGPVIYIAGEGKNGIGRRFLGWSIVHGTDLNQAPLYLSTVPLGLCDADQVQAAMDAVEEIAEMAGPPAMIVIDTVARNFGPGDENSTADMGRFIAAADQIRSLYHSAVHLVHHTGHGDKKRARGSMALKGAIDAEYRLEKDQDGTVRVKATKMKDASIPDPMAFEIRGVDLPLKDEDGDTVTSAVLHRVEYSEPAAPVKKTGKALGVNQRKALDLLERLYAVERKRLMNQGIKPVAARVSIERWGSKCKEAGMNRQTVHRIKASLDSCGLIKIEDSHVIPL